MAIQIKSPGFFSILQDQGRSQHAETGVSPGLPMDESLFYLANHLVGNPQASPAIEFLMEAPVFEITGDHVIAVTGDVDHVKVNGFLHGANRSIHVRAGDQVSIGPFKSGCRGYIAISGLEAGPAFLDSVTYEDKTGFGIKLKGGEILEASFHSVNRLGRLNRQCGPVRLLKGPDYDRFTPLGQRTLVASSYEVSQASNRMGIRLKGPVIGHVAGADILSRPLVMGTVQVPKDGQPIVMMSDHQPTGGYTVIGTVVKEDLWRLAQMRPGDRLDFQWTSLDQELVKQSIEWLDVYSKKMKVSINHRTYHVEVSYENQL